MIRQMDPGSDINDVVCDILEEYADTMVEEVMKSACALAKHRKSNVVDTKDVHLHLGTAPLPCSVLL
jgi:transcription initiation factor TFIID subunit 12